MKTVKQPKSHLPLVAIIGRVNVGKSTLFNKLIEKQKALISKIPGTTRDLNFGICEWQGVKFEVVDTGGIFETNSQQPTINNQQKEKIIRGQVEKKAREIIEKSDLLLFMVDAKVGLLQNDRLIAQLVKRTKKPFLLVVNKIDKINITKNDEFKKLGLGEPVPIAAASGVGVGDLLDKVIKTLKHENMKTLKKKEAKILTPFRAVRNDLPKGSQNIKVCIIGKPNVGKSSLLNQILGEERVIVSPLPHTTREPQDTIIVYDEQTIEVVDTAGIRRKAKVEPDSLESAGIMMSIKALKKSEVVLFVLDISENLTSQDAELAGLIIDSGISLIFVANKYDLLETEPKTSQELSQYIYNYFPFLTWAPIIFTSGLTGRNCQKILPLILEVKAARKKQIGEEELNEFLKYLIKKMPPPRQQRILGGRKSRAFISKLIQVKADRPIFEMHIINITKVPDPYLRYIENNIRNRFKFIGTPIKIRIIRNQ